MQDYDRRRIIRGGVTLALGGVAAARAHDMANATPQQPIRPVGVHAFYDSASVSPSARTPLQDLDGIITPNPLHFVTSHGILPPEIEPENHRLLVHGMVERPLVFHLEDIKRLPSVTRMHFIQCAGSSYVNIEHRLHSRTAQETHGKTSNSLWTGVPLSIVLNEAGLKKGAKWLLAEDVTERHTISIPLEKAMDDSLLCIGQNGEAVYPSQGYPLRLLTPGWEGVRNVKWLRRLEVGDRPFMTRWETTNYVNLHPDGKSRWFQFQLEPNSVITYPSGEQQLSEQGFYEIRGLAWSGGGSVARVEVSTDGGGSWQDAELEGPVLPKAHVRFRLPWRWSGKESVIQSRCIDDAGDIQPTLAELSRIWNVKKDYWLSTADGENRIQHFNAVQPWRIRKDGSVHNAIWEI